MSYVKGRTMSKRGASLGDVSPCVPRMIIVSVPDGNPRHKKRSRVQEEDEEEDEHTCEETIVSSFEDTINSDLLYKIMHDHVASTDWKACWGVCRRWRDVAVRAFNPFATTRALYAAMMVKPETLPMLLSDGRLEHATLTREVIVNGCVMISDLEMRVTWIAKTVRTCDMLVVCMFHAIAEKNAILLEALCQHAARAGLRLSTADTKNVLLKLASVPIVMMEQEDNTQHRRRAAAAVVSVCRMIERTSHEAAASLRASGYVHFLMQNRNTFMLTCLLRCKSVRKHAATVNVLCVHAFTTQDRVLLRCLCDAKRARVLSAENCWHAFILACANDWTEVVHSLLSGGGGGSGEGGGRVDPSAHSQRALRVAAGKGSAGVVARLLEDPRCDPGADNNVAVILALKHGHVGVATMLVTHKLCLRTDSHSPVQSVLTRAITLGIKDKSFYEALARKQALNPNEHAHSPVRLALATKNYEALEMLLGFDDALELSDEEKGTVLRTIAQRADLVQRMFKEQRFGSSLWGRCM